MTPANFQQLANFIWSVADLLRGPYRPPQYERVMLPLTVLRRFEYFEFEKEIEKMEEANRLYLVVSKFAEIDLHPRVVDNITMGLVFEDLIRRFNEAANETAGDHFTPREVIRLMVNLLLEPDGHILTQEGIIVTVCDPACGTGGMLSESQNWIRAHNDSATVRVFGQDYNPRSYAVAASDLLIKDCQGQLMKMVEDRGEGARSHLPTRKYAVIIDEAHSSQSGETATELKGVLGGAGLLETARKMAEEEAEMSGYAALIRPTKTKEAAWEEDEVELERLFRSMAKRGRQPNMSFFAFTATPKHKTLAISLVRQLPT
jgi:hypothetical protein